MVLPDSRLPPFRGVAESKVLDLERLRSSDFGREGSAGLETLKPLGGEGVRSPSGLERLKARDVWRQSTKERLVPRIFGFSWFWSLFGAEAPGVSSSKRRELVLLNPRVWWCRRSLASGANDFRVGGGRGLRARGAEGGELSGSMFRRLEVSWIFGSALSKAGEAEDSVAQSSKRRELEKPGLGRLEVSRVQTRCTERAGFTGVDDSRRGRSSGLKHREFQRPTTR